MICSFCGSEFDESKVITTCIGCLFFKSCKMVKCPNCGYDSPIEPILVKKLRGK